MLTGLSACTGATESAARVATAARLTAGMATMAGVANGAAWAAGSRGHLEPQKRHSPSGGVAKRKSLTVLIALGSFATTSQIYIIGSKIRIMSSEC